MLMKRKATTTMQQTEHSGITLESLRVSYHNNVVLKPLDLTIDSGEILVLIGPSGSEKPRYCEPLRGLLNLTAGASY